MRKLLKALIAGRQRSTNWKIAQQLQHTEYPNETPEFVYSMLNERTGC